MISLMTIRIVICLVVIFVTQVLSQGVFDFKLIDFDTEQEISLQQYKNTKAILITNVALNDGLTFINFKQLQHLYEKYHDKGLEILAIMNDFGQESSIVVVKPHIGKIPLFSKTVVSGESIHPLFNYLVEQTNQIPISWNFAKFLIDAKNGKPIKRYAPQVSPLNIEHDIINL